MTPLVSIACAAACSASPASAPAAPSAAATPVARRVGTMSELMVDFIYPASDAVFYISTRTPTTSEEWATRTGAPTGGEGNGDGA